MKNTPYAYDYTGGEQTFTAPCNGYYKLEVWGASGGDSYGVKNGVIYKGGYGGYAIGVKNLFYNSSLKINVGGRGQTHHGVQSMEGSYNGGGSIQHDNGDIVNNWYRQHGGGTGGGATHIATKTGQLQNLSAYKGPLVNNSYYNSSEIIIVAGGGGGSGDFYWPSNGVTRYGNGGHGGGYIGNNPTNIYNDSCSWSDSYRPTQIMEGKNGCDMSEYDGAFGLGATGNASGGGGGWYGGGSSMPAHGGSGYIGSSNLISGGGVTKHMTCHSCTTSSVAATRTYSNTNVSATATADYSKTGNGYARITYLGPTV